eukprot:TRINITY_DN659_c0_g1_i2.p2 TRINITY_DN659_c0_g1~~TRINITY_DN659_c0_g1_i2.p2  ORF type:complete len:147 (+),score=28.53 TRINITY_DN659_c0_g1_i2:873-1313(+)
MDSSSFAGANVISWTTEIELLKQGGVPASQLPPTLPTTATARFNNHESYYGEDFKLPREFYLTGFDWAVVYAMGHSKSTLTDLYETAAAVLASSVPDGLLAQSQVHHSWWSVNMSKIDRDEGTTTTPVVLAGGGQHPRVVPTPSRI